MVDGAAVRRGRIARDERVAIRNARGRSRGRGARSTVHPGVRGAPRGARAPSAEPPRAAEKKFQPRLAIDLSAGCALHRVPIIPAPRRKPVASAARAALDRRRVMGAGSSKAAGGAAAAAAKTVNRRKLPDAASSSASLITRPPPGGRDGASRDDAHAFFRPLRPNDGTLAPVKPTAEVDVEKMVKEKDVTLVRRMDQLAGAITMSRLEISGHKRASEMAAARRAAAETRPTVRIEHVVALFRRVAAADADGEAIDVHQLAERFRANPETLQAMLRRYRDAQPEEVTDRSPGAPPGAMKAIKRWSR